MPRKNSKQFKGYSRVDYESSHGWLVRIRRGGETRSSFVSDKKHGGKRKSKVAAEELYTQWCEEVGEIQSSVGKMNARNVTGVVGVHKAIEKDTRYPHLVYQSYIASWVDENGHRKKCGFSSSKYGKDAFALACLAREKRLTDREAVFALFSKNQPKSSAKIDMKTTKKKKTLSRKLATSSRATKKTAVSQAIPKELSKKKPTRKKPPAKKK